MNLISSDGSILITTLECVTDLKTKPGGNVLSTVTTPSFLFGGNGSTLPLSGNVRLSQVSGNTLILNPDGLYVGIPTITETLLTAINSPTITLTLSGLSSHTLRADLKISPQIGNALSVTSNGLYVSPTTGGTYTDAQARNSLSATSPVIYNNTAGIIGIRLATAITGGYLSASDWNVFNSKEPGITLGTTSQYWRGDKTWQTLNTTAVTEGINQYFTAIRARNSISVTAPLTYNAVTGVFGIVPASGSQDGYLGSGDWSIFTSKVSDGISLASVSAQSVYKDKTTGNVLEFRGIKGGIGITATLVADDIVLNATGVIPGANAGADQNVTLPATTATMAGLATTTSGTVISATWLLLSGPAGSVITDASSLATTVTGLVEGVYVYRLVVVNSFGFVSTDDVVITVSESVVTADTIYVGATGAVGTTPTAATILAGISSLQNGAGTVTADWRSFNSTPQFCFFAIPDTDSDHEKNRWFIDTLNKGNIGGPSDLFGALTTVVVNSVTYSVGITNYQTQFASLCLLQKV